ncbi:glycosyltransferase family 4 protein [Halodesulfurarchaeum formicicum]|uniref:Glycosyl transferase family 1 n=1 Tax=Halodesulfurarchaeum formicicum TaxID=1873524 RepID=A0A1J1AC74_9EURY|nr:glycosyltransferase family 4 protein [Halodesulfurarchaeum formicicum]APE95327.1 glycosyl transferase family 1 [Halodesulfurarchaeum formicicum]
MKILWLRPSKGDNISVRRERIASELRERGYTVDIVDASGWDAPKAIWKALTGSYDIIAGNVRVGLYLGYPIARLLRTPFLGDVSDPISDIDYLPEPLFRFFERYEWWVLERADATVFVYKSSYQEALDRGIDDAVRLPNAVDYEAFADPNPEAVRDAESILREEGVDLDNPIAIYLGVLTPSYKIEAILETAQHAPEWEFVFIGEGDLADTVRQEAQSQDNVHYPGAFEYRLMPGFLAHADVGFCFKDAEQPLKLKEYGAAGLPTIVRPGELSKWYDDNELAFLEPDPEAIVDRLDELGSNQEMYATYSEAGREIGSEWSWEEIAEGYIRIFEDKFQDLVSHSELL